MSGKRRLTKSIKGLDVTKQDKPRQVRGILGNTINGNQVVEVPTRPGYVWVRLRDQQSEIIQAFNDNVSPVYDLPVFVTRDSDDPTRYIVIGRDTAQYANWGAGAAYLPRHANQHSFSDDAGAAGDVVWVYGRQFMPMLAYPSGSAGAGNVIISPYTYFSQAQDWVYSGGTGTASIVAYKPTGSNARVVLVYMDTNGNPQLLAGSYFAATITGTSQVIQYLPDLPNNTKPIAAIRLVSGTSIINWSNIYDIRQFYNDSVVAPTTPSLGLAIYDDHVFKVTGTAIDFTDNISVAVTGSFVYVSSTGGGSGSGTGTVGARVYREQDQLIPRLTGTAIAFTHEHYDTDSIHSGSSTQLFCNTAGYYAIIGNAQWQADNNGTRELYIRLNGNNATVIGKVKDNVAATSNNMGQCVATIWQLNQGDYVELFAYHESINGSLVVVGEASLPNYSTEFMMQRFGDVGSTIISTGTVVVNNTYNTYNANNVLPIFDDGVFKVTGTAISFDDNLTVIVSGTVAFISSAASGGGLSALPIQDDGVFVVSGTAISFDKDLIVTASGTVAHVEVPVGTFASGSHTHPAGATAIQIYEDGVYKATGTAISFNNMMDVIVTGTVAYVNSSLGWFNVKEYGATGDGVTDDTTAIQAAITAAGNANGGVVYFPAGIYIVGGALQDGSGANAQLTLPQVHVSDDEWITIVLLGESPPVNTWNLIGTNPIPTGGSVIKGTLNSGAGGSLLGAYGPVGSYNNFTGVNIKLKDIRIQMPTNPVLTAANLNNCIAIDVDNVVVHPNTMAIDSLTQPTTATSYGFKTPKVNNGAHIRLDGLSIIGFYNGLEVNEHTNGLAVKVAGCINALVFPENGHSSWFGRLVTEWCVNGLVFNGSHHLSIELYNTEHHNPASPKWYDLDYDVVDLSNYGLGYIVYHATLSGLGTDDTFVVNGGSNLHIRKLEDAIVAASTGTASIPTYPAIYEKGSFVATGTSITFDGNLEVSISGSFVSISAPITTYFRVGQPSLIGGTVWQVPDRVYASGSLAVSIDGLMKTPNMDYQELLWVSGTYQYLSTPATGTVHLVMYGVPCTSQTQTSSGGVSAFALLDSNDVLLLDSNSVQILDSNG